MLWSRIEPAQPSKLRAGPLTIDRAERRATLGGKALELSPLLFRLLERLVEHPGHVVTRAELKRVLWPYAERIDTERRLNTAMRALRGSLGDDAEMPRFIETVRSHGYRWIGHRERSPRAAAALAATAALSLALSPLPVSVTPDLAATLKAQNAMEQWRREPTPATARRASTLLAEAGNAGAPSLLAMKAELELGSQWRWADAERDYGRALHSEPGNADARLGLAWLRANQGRRDEALALVNGLANSSVLSGDRRASLGWLLIRLGRPDLAAATCGSDASASINDLSCSDQAFAALGRYAEAKATALRVMERVPASRAAIEQVRGQPSREAYAAFLDWRARNFLPADAPWFQRAQVLADAGANDQALRALERSVALREPMAVKIASTPSFNALRNKPGFQLLLRQVGLSA
jgi:DNA-binding winged helix-turn-helix (wHTH) protein